MLVNKLLATLKRILPPGLLLLALLLVAACGTLDVRVEEPGLPELPAVTEASPMTTTAAGEAFPAVAWYGTVHAVSGSAAGNDYLKPWHLAIWPKYGPAVGLTGIDPAVNDEIDRLRDQDSKATFWGEMTCGVDDYGGCQLLVERLSADDGGPTYEADRVEGWQGSVGRLPGQPGSSNDLLYFILDGQVAALYGIAGADPALQAELERLAEGIAQPEGGGDIRIWGELVSKAQPVTGSVIEVERLEEVSR